MDKQGRRWRVLPAPVAGGSGQVTRTVRDPAEWGLPRCSPDDLAGGDATGNAARIKAVFEGEEHGPHRDALVLGAALVLELTGRAAGPQGSTERVIATLDDGAAARLLSRLACAGREKG